MKFEIPVDLECPTDVFVTGSGNAELQEHHLSLSSLPPIFLEIVLPPAYPLRAAPSIVSFHVSGSWVPRSGRLLEKLIDLWQPGHVILYTWVEWIRSAEFLASMNMIQDDVLRIPHPAPQLLLPFLTAHESESQSSKFSLASYSCDVCFETLKGSRCLQLICGHVFCRACLKDGWSLYISEGDVARVGCLDPQCVKDGQEATEDEVRRVVAEGEVRRWKWLREKKATERGESINHPSIVLCPISLCQTPVPRPLADVQDETGWVRLRTCPSCNYSFCSICKRTWHGPLSDCPIEIEEKLVIEYTETTDDSPIRKTMHRRYGKRNLERLVAKRKEARANREWLEKSTMACPKCQVHVEKSMGCNHMTCYRCKQHFCYRCGSKVQASNPYGHFSRSGCRLFDATDEPMEGFVWV
ncbi:hypothetical protein BC826DRAFT_908281 [Russula brevipes]|nr:hypothetical protein BC826DRAFT_908281 [Russula brevipes]